MEKYTDEEKRALKDYFDKEVKETMTNYKQAGEFFQKELNKIPFTELEFKNYKDCYRKLGQIFSNNGVIWNQCVAVLNYKSKNDGSLNQRWKYEEKGDYHYKNCYNQQECHVKCENRVYKLKYRKLDVSKYRELIK